MDKIYIIRANKEFAYGHTNKLAQNAYIHEVNTDKISYRNLCRFSFAGSMSNAT